MLSSGIRTPVGVKAYGPELAGIDQVSRAVEAAARTVPGTTSAFAERVEGGYHLDIEPNRPSFARYGITENAQLVNYVYVDMHGRDIGGYVAEAQRAVAETGTMPPGFHLEWSRQFECLQGVRARLAVVVPVTLPLIFVLLYLTFGRPTVMLSVPFALVGGIWLMDWMHFNISVAVAVGFIALAGVAAETSDIMLIYLGNALAEEWQACQARGQALTQTDLRRAIIGGAVERVRPQMMTVTAIMAGLLPILWSSGTGRS